MDYQHLLVSRAGPVATVTFNRPAKANALNYSILEEIEHVALSFRDDIETRVVIFTGAGKHFSSGYDLTDSNTQYGGPLVLRRRRNRMGARAIMALYNIDQITVAAWNGAAMGGGACIATALDFRIAAANCVMRYPEVDLGINLSWQSLPLCVHLVGAARAKRLVIGCEPIGGTTLLEWGALDDLVPDKQLLSRAHEFASFYAAKPPVAAQMVKRSINKISSALDQSIMDMDADQNLQTRDSADSAEAIRAYLAQAEPTFIGD
ncbi:MAG: enoyl-CoA hydratase [Gammaproteobacteria bacterium]|jgi:enoyl-CoA hydratase